MGRRARYNSPIGAQRDKVVHRVCLRGPAGLLLTRLSARDVRKTRVLSSARRTEERS